MSYNETDLRIKSLWRMALKLRRLTEQDSWNPPLGIRSKLVNDKIDDLCDQVELLIDDLCDQVELLINELKG